MKGIDVVLSAIGGPFEAGNQTRSLGMKKIVEGMTSRSKKRIIGIGGLGILNTVIDEETGETEYIYKTPDFPKQYKAVSEEHFKAYQHLAASNLDWTFVCPPDIINAGATGHYNVNKDFPAEGKFEINAGDIAEFMMKELKENEYLTCRVGIAAQS